MKVVKCCSILIGVLSFGFAEWTAIGPFGGPLRSVVIAPSDESVMYIASDGSPSTILQSLDGGASWSKQGEIPNYVYDMAVDPTDPLIIYVGTYQTVYKSTNGGVDWTSSSVSISYVYGVEVHPTAPANVYAAGMMTSGSYNVMGFFKSTNGGASWSSTPLHTTYNGLAMALTLDQTNPSIIYVGGYYFNVQNSPKVYKSSNGGTTFADMSTGFSTAGTYVNCLKTHPTNSDIVYATTFYDGLYRTTNGGISWTKVLSEYFLSCLATTQAAPAVAYAGKDTLIYKSIDAGASWFLTGSGFYGVYKLPRGLAACQNNASVVYTVDRRGCFISTNAGGSWQESNSGMALASILTFAVAPSAPATIYTEFEEVCTFKTTDCGSTWIMLPATLDCGNICEFAVNYQNPSFVMALEGSG